jgi:hypothetical protein
MRIIVLTVGLLMVLAVSQTEAQTCRGAPSFTAHPTQAGVAASFIGDRRDIGGTFAVGRQSLFGEIGVSATHIRFIGTAPSISGSIGAEFRSSDRPVFTCPVFQAGYASGPALEPFDASSVALRGGIGVGAIVAETHRGVKFIPTFGLAVLYDRATVTLSTFENTNAVWSGIATLGIGFLFNDNLSVIPALEVPFSAGTAESGFSLRWVYGFSR